MTKLSFTQIPKKINLVYSEIRGRAFKDKLTTIQKKYHFNSETTIKYILDSIENDESISAEDILCEIAEKKLRSKCSNLSCNFKCWE